LKSDLMKIIFSTYETKEIGGSFLRSLSLAQALNKLDHKVCLWTSSKTISLLPKISNNGGVKIIESIGLLPYRFRRGGYDPFDIIFRTLVIIFSKCDIIHSFNHRPAATIPAMIKNIFCKKSKWFLDWADLWGKGGIADRRYGHFRFLTANLDHYTEKFFIKITPVVTAISDDLIKKAKLIRGNKRKTFFLGVGANIDHIQVIDKISARSKLEISKNIKVLVYLYVGTYDEELLARTFVALNKLRSDVVLLLLGPSLLAFEKIMSKHPSLSNKILRKGIIEREKLAEHLATGDLMLLPFADKEINRGKFPNKLGDYLASGRPIIANPTGEIKKILIQERVGILVEEDPLVFAEAIDKNLKQVKKLEKLGQNARLLAEKMSWLSIAQKLESLYLK
jgi:glycosyltransferase involved in cell wall biosynthesis